MIFKIETKTVFFLVCKDICTYHITEFCKNSLYKAQGKILSVRYKNSQAYKNGDGIIFGVIFIFLNFSVLWN